MLLKQTQLIKQSMTRASSSHASSIGAGAAQPKPCHTCARQITPRAKFKANFDDVKYCASSCRDQKPGRVIRWSDRKEVLGGTLGTLAKTREGLEEQEGTKREVDLERWVEVCLLDVAREAGGKAPLPTCEDVEVRLQDEVKSLGEGDESASPSAPEQPQHPLLKALHSPPGLRERVRRAARRQIIFRPEGLNGTLLLYTKGRTTPLVTLEDVSYAKGPISLKWEARNA